MRRRDLFKEALAALFAAKLPMPSTMTVPVAPAVTAYAAMSSDQFYGPSIFDMIDREKFYVEYNAILDRIAEQQDLIPPGPMA